MYLKNFGWLGCVGVLMASAHTQAEQSLEQAASDPAASLMNVQVSNWYTEDFHNLSVESANTVLLRSAIPFTVGRQANIFRISAPIITGSPISDTGLSDRTVFDLLTLNQPMGGRWGAGVVALLPTGGSKRGTEKWGWDRLSDSPHNNRESCGEYLIRIYSLWPGTATARM